MASAKGYTDKTAIENFTLKTIASTFNTQIDSWITAIEMYIDKMTGRSFAVDGEASERVYDGNGEMSMNVDDFIPGDDGIVLKINDTTIASTEYYLYPNNSATKNKITLKSSYFYKGNQNISVETTWGYTATAPADIKLAATVLVAGIMSPSTPGKRSETIGSYSVTYDSDQGWKDFNHANKIIQSYKKYSL